MSSKSAVSIPFILNTSSSFMVESHKDRMSKNKKGKTEVKGAEDCRGVKTSKAPLEILIIWLSNEGFEVLLFFLANLLLPYVH